MNTKTTTTTMEASEKDRKRVQWIRDDNRGGSGLTTGPMDSKLQHSVNFLAIVFLTVTLSRFDIVFIIFYFSFTAKNNISTAIMLKIFLHQVYTNLAFVTPTYSRFTKKRILMINKDVHKSLARKNRNDNSIWI